MRQLASVQRIIALTPIEGADAIEKATVLGWQLVVKKGEFQVGDLVVYCEIDSILPDWPEFQFLKPRGFRIRTIKLKGQISQGICFPLSILPSFLVVQEGTDCTQILGITKYEPAIPASLTGVAKGKFPSFIPKTDETRVQNLQKVLDKYKGTECYITEKIDGSSATFYLNEGVFGVCSRNLDLVETEDNSFWIAARKFNIEEKLRSVNRNIAIQGELFGPGIQGNKLKVPELSLRIFNVFDIDDFKYLDCKEFLLFCMRFELRTVPILDHYYTLDNNIEGIIRKAEFKSVLNPSVWAEGIVIRPREEKIDLMLSNENFHNGRLSFKAINPQFLLKYE